MKGNFAPTPEPDDGLLTAVAAGIYAQHTCMVGRSSLPRFDAADEATRERFRRYAMAALTARQHWLRGKPGRPASSPRKPMTGLRFGRLTVLGPAGSDANRQALWRCACDCGRKEHVVRGSALRKGDTKSCGCARQEHGRRAVEALHERRRAAA